MVSWDGATAPHGRTDGRPSGPRSGRLYAWERMRGAGDRVEVGAGRFTAGGGHHEAALHAMLLAELNDDWTWVERLRTTATQVTTIRASITAYSTAVGPSSLTRKRRVLANTLHIEVSFTIDFRGGERVSSPMFPARGPGLTGGSAGPHRSRRGQGSVSPSIGMGQRSPREAPMVAHRSLDQGGVPWHGNTRGLHRSRCGAGRFTTSGDHHEAALIVLLTELNVVWTWVARFWITTTQATTIRDVITAYSTAVGPSSLIRKRRVRANRLHIEVSFTIDNRGGGRVTSPTFARPGTRANRRFEPIRNGPGEAQGSVSPRSG